MAGDFADLQAVLSIKDNLSAGLANVQQSIGKLEGSLSSLASGLKRVDTAQKQVTLSMQQFYQESQRLNTQLGGWGKQNFDRMQELKIIADRLANARTVMIGYGNSAKNAANAQVPLATAMENVDEISNKQIARFTKLTFKLVALQTSTFSLGSVAAHAGDSVKRGFDAAHVALASFVGVITFAHGPMGLFVGGLLGIVTGLSSFILSSKSAEERFKGLQERITTLRQSLLDSRESISKNMDILRLAGQKPSDVGEAVLQKLINQLETLREITPDLQANLIGDNGLLTQIKSLAANAGYIEGFAPIQKQLNDLAEAVGEQDPTKIKEVSDAIATFLNAGKYSKEFREKVVGPLRLALITIQEFSDVLNRIKQNPVDIVNQRNLNLLTKSKEAVVEFSNEVRDIQQTAERSKEFGITNQLELARAAASAASRQLNGLLELIQKLKIATRDETITEEQRAKIESLIKDIMQSQLGSAISQNKLAEENLKLQERIFKMGEKFKEMNLKFGFQKAVEEWTDEFATLKDVFKDIFDTMKDSFSDIMYAMMGSGKKFRDTMRQIFRDIGNSFKRMIADFASQQFLRELLMTISPGSVYSPGSMLTPAALSLAGGGGPAAASLASASLGAGGSIMGNPFLTAAPAAASVPGAGLFGGSGILGLSAGLSGLLGAGAVMGATQAKDPVSGGLLGGAGGAMLGGALVAGPIGALIGGVLGAGLGIFSGGKAKEEEEKAKEAEEEAAQQAAEELERQRALAQDLILTQLRTRYGGGLATPEAAVSMGQLMSGGLSPEEIAQFGDPAAIAAQAQQIMGTAANIMMGGLHVAVTAYVSGNYDVQRLGEDIGSYTIGFVESALAGGV